MWEDVIGRFLAYTDGVRSPEIFRLWSAIAMVAGALERRVWVNSGTGAIYPNLYTLLVAPPGVGKYIIETVKEFWTTATEPGTKVPAFRVAPDSVSRASLVDDLAKAKSTRVTPEGPMLTYHSLLVAAEEFGVFLPSYDSEFLYTLNALWGNKPLHKETRRHGDRKLVEIENPQLNILGGYQPSIMGLTFPEEAWASGFTRRLLMIYSDEEVYQDFFYAPELPEGARGAIVRDLGAISRMYGKMLWGAGASEKISDWDARGNARSAPSHSKLQYYARRGNRTLMLAKLAIISAVSRSGTKVIEEPDVARALEWLLAAERKMPDIFRAMIGRSDSQVLEELHLFGMREFAVKRKAIPGELMFQFLASRVPSDKVERVFALAVRAGLFKQLGEEDLWMPRPKPGAGLSYE